MREISNYVASIVILMIAMTMVELILPNHKNKLIITSVHTQINVSLNNPSPEENVVKQTLIIL